jgi:hypothetical protein
LAQLLGHAGTATLVASRAVEGGALTVHQITRAGTEALFVGVDVMYGAEVEALIIDGGRSGS